MPSCCFVMFFCLHALHYLQTHAGVVVRTFPEASFVVVVVDRAILVDAPVPLTILVVNKMGLDIIPATLSNGKVVVDAEVLPKVNVTNDIRTLHPPLQRAVGIA